MSYTVLCLTVGSEALLRESVSNPDVTITGLHPYYTYQCNVSAVTVAEGPFSNFVQITTLEDGMFITLVHM